MSTGDWEGLIPTVGDTASTATANVMIGGNRLARRLAIDPHRAYRRSRSTNNITGGWIMARSSRSGASDWQRRQAALAREAERQRKAAEQARKAAEKEAQRQHVEARKQHVESKNQQLASRVDELDSILHRGLGSFRCPPAARTKPTLRTAHNTNRSSRSSSCHHATSCPSMGATSTCIRDLFHGVQQLQVVGFNSHVHVVNPATGKRPTDYERPTTFPPVDGFAVLGEQIQRVANEFDLGSAAGATRAVVA